MTNPSKKRGTAAESALVRWARDNGFPHARRKALEGANDAGDVELVPDQPRYAGAVVLEVKAVATAATGQPPPALLAAWLDETERERANAGADFAALVVKRRGTTDPARWWAYIRLGHLLDLFGYPWDTGETGDAPICLSVESLTRALRANGYGAPLTETENNR